MKRTLTATLFCTALISLTSNFADAARRGNSRSSARRTTTSRSAGYSRNRYTPTRRGTTNRRIVTRRTPANRTVTNRTVNTRRVVNSRHNVHSTRTHKHFIHGKPHFLKHHKVHNYHVKFGKKFKFGYYYVGKTHQHWTKRVWFAKYNRYCFWCPNTHAYYYWHAGRNRYYPVNHWVAH